METLLQEKTPSHILSALNALPETVDDSYDKALERIKYQGPKNVKLAFHIISWITQAYRSLSVSELAYALEMTEGNYSNIKDYLDQEQIISICQGLVEVSQDSNEVTLVRKYLLNLSYVKYIDV